MSTRRESNEILDGISQHPSTAAVPGTPRRAEKAELLHQLLSEFCCYVSKVITTFPRACFSSKYRIASSTLLNE